MTDFKYKFNETYHLSITVECGSTVTATDGPYTYYYIPTTVKVYINGEQQTTAYMAFNPLINGNGSGGGARSRTKTERTQNSPIQPGFYQTNGTIYSPISNSHIINCKLPGGGNKNNQIGWSNLYLGKSNIAGGGALYNATAAIPSSQGNANIKRYLNNIDVGVIQVYNAALSQTDIKNIYDTFGPRYQ
jgi:hypothetical protein